ncbi:hypothetical protein [Nitratireductor luteus]|uniref:hypothetical protein n=1 Tax=Nitratireductor luteus TaxID=2976980 RepID=UPI0022409C94|nr:hypothetical protein [Nitratireductor luteus]
MIPKEARIIKLANDATLIPALLAFAVCTTDEAGPQEGRQFHPVPKSKNAEKAE